MGGRRLAATSWGVTLLLASCVGSSFDPPPSPLPVDLQSAVGTWYDSNGAPLPQGRPFVMTVWRGPTHCGWEDLLFLVISWPLGTEVRGPYLGSRDTRTFVRLSSTNDFAPSDFASTFDANAALPPGAYDTGYNRDGWHLWASDSRIGDAVWLVHDDSVERWPAEKRLIGCA